MQVRNSWGIRLDLAEISKKTQNLHLKKNIFWPQICVTAPKIIVSDQGQNWCRQSWRRSIAVALPNPSPVKRFYQKMIPIHKQVTIRTSGITAMRRSISRVPVWNFNLVFKQHVRTNGSLPPPFFFQTLRSPLYFFGWLHRVYLSKKHDKKCGRLSILLVGAW